LATETDAAPHEGRIVARVGVREERGKTPHEKILPEGGEILQYIHSTNVLSCVVADRRSDSELWFSRTN
jgi:hypothetical protein